MNKNNIWQRLRGWLSRVWDQLCDKDGSGKRLADYCDGKRQHLDVNEEDDGDQH
jgi:hypothetical protein